MCIRDRSLCVSLPVCLSVSHSQTGPVMLSLQASISEGRVVDRARAWCSMINAPYYRFSPQLSEDVALDCHDHDKLIQMMWETHCYMVANRNRVNELANLLKASDKLH